MNNRVKYSVFIPPANRRLSVFRISGLSESDVWRIGETVGTQRALPLLARANIKAVSVTEIGLEIDADDVPPRHASIIGWPEEASAIKLKAIELAGRSLLRLQ
ncbi:MAG: hypothetical protein AB1638_04000 [Nitrospirota bacterium]